MPNITFSYDAHNDNENVSSPSLITPSVDYSFNVPSNLPLSLEEMQQHFNQWLQVLGYQVD